MNRFKRFHGTDTLHGRFKSAVANSPKRTILTHPGKAHRDEFMSCCLLIAGGMADRIERRDATLPEVFDPEVIVLDQGGRHGEEMMNFDHHQFERDAAPACSITLVLPLLGVDAEVARSIWGWLEFTERMDSKGPFATAKALGLTPDALLASASPIEATVLRWFQEQETLGESSPLWGLMERIGKEKLQYLEKLLERFDYLYDNIDVIKVGRSNETGVDLLFVDARCVDRSESPAMGLTAYCEALAKRKGAIGREEIVGTITQDDRGAGTALYRWKDHPVVDFSRLEGHPDVEFAHKGGFIAKVKEGVDPTTLLGEACGFGEGYYLGKGRGFGEKYYQQTATLLRSMK